MKPISEKTGWEKEFDKLKSYLTENYSLNDYENGSVDEEKKMFEYIKDFIRSLLATRSSQLREEYNQKDRSDIPAMGVSQWRNHGAKYGYDKFFESKIRNEKVKKFEEKG